MDYSTGTIVGEIKGKRQEHVGIDDTITDEIDVIMFYNPKNPLMVEFYDKELGVLIEQKKISELMKLIPIERLIELLPTDMLDEMEKIVREKLKEKEQDSGS